MGARSVNFGPPTGPQKAFAPILSAIGLYKSFWAISISKFENFDESSNRAKLGPDDTLGSFGYFLARFVTNENVTILYRGVVAPLNNGGELDF